MERVFNWTPWESVSRLPPGDKKLTFQSEITLKSSLVLWIHPRVKHSVHNDKVNPEGKTYSIVTLVQISKSAPSEKISPY